MKTLLARSVPDLITQHSILQSTLLSQERSTNCRLLVWLKLVRDLEERSGAAEWAEQRGFGGRDDTYET